MMDRSHSANNGKQRRPAWLRVPLRESARFRQVDQLLEGLKLSTVCREARCPNIWECWGEHGTATFLILGDVCTRACQYCSVKKGRPAPVDAEEPERVARAVSSLALSHVVVTSVDRDDLPDFGAGQFAATVAAIRRARPQAAIELLVPDFNLNEAALEQVLAARPEVLGHNLETVPRLFPRLRPRGSYDRSIALLHRVAEYASAHSAAIVPKSGLMLGFGERPDEVLSVVDDLSRAGCEVLTLGQYLNPTTRHAPVARFYTPEEFVFLEQEARARGMRHVESGPLVRSSYHAHLYAG